MIWKSKRNRSQKRDATVPRVRRQTRGPERLEARRLFAADAIHIGVVYLETDYLESDQDVGGDSRGDRFILSFTGGAANTELTELRISTDKDGDGISVGDPIFDTQIGGRGKNGAHDFRIVKVIAADGRSVQATAEVADGGQELILRLTNFRAGDRLEFTLDVDEVLRNSSDLAVFNDRLDVITSGQEFQDSILNATFTAPHYETSHADAIFLNDYGNPAAAHGLNLPPDEGSNVDSRPNRSAAAVASTVQTPKPVDLAGHVWLDNNLNNVRESGEAPLAAVELALWHRGTDGVFRDTGFRATTDAAGKYSFSKSLGLQPGTYRIIETQPSGLYSVGAVPGTAGGTASGRAESPDILTDIHLPLGDTSAVNYDFGEAAPASLAGNVYRDDNNNGRRDAGEIGIGGVQVRLVPYDTIAPQSVITVTTAADGSYRFTGLAPGHYDVVQLDQPADLNDGLDAAGTVDGKVVGFAINPGDHIEQIVLSGGDVGIEYNFAEVPFGSISGSVYLIQPGYDCTDDATATGTTPLAGVVVELQSELGFTIARTSTGSDGSYTFDNVPVGTYRVLEYTPNGLLDGKAHVGRINQVSVGRAIGGGTIEAITMTPAGVGREYNFCEIAPASISGVVYHDQSNDGRRDDNEAPIAGATVSLINIDGVQVGTAVTDAAGRYQFDNLVPGEYTIVERQPNGYFDGLDSVGTVRGQSRGQISGNDVIAVTLGQGDVGIDYNFGELLPASLFGRVYVDVDGDCELDDDELTLADVTIRLIDADGHQVASTQTDGQGRYAFRNLTPGVYTVIEEQPAGYFEGNAMAGSAGGQVVGGSRIESIELASGQTAVEYDFCERPPAEINGTVFADSDANFRFDPNEPGIAAVRVELFNDEGQRIADTITDAQGRYRFTNLPAGNYTVRETQPPGWLQGGQFAGDRGGDDSQRDVISRIPVGWGERLTQYNFSELEPASVSGVVFVDGNGDCNHDAGEQPLAGVAVELRDATGRVIARTTTDASGQYQFENLVAGEYQIFEHQPDGMLQGGQKPGTGDGRVLGDDLLGVNLLTGQRLVRYNFCELEPASVRGHVYVDNDGDCTRDDDELPLENVAIELRDASGKVIARTITDASGNYHFDGLPPGRYQIFEQQPDGLFQGGQRVGTGDGEVLGDDLLGVRLASGQHLVDYNFCELPPSSISGRVWQDLDMNQRFEPGETPVPGVLVELIDDDDLVVARSETDASGRYTFTALAPGVYAVRQTQPQGLFHGGQVIGDAGGDIGGDDLLVGIRLHGGTDARQYDFPEVPPATISGHVFQDGDSIRVAGPLDPALLREYRDGVLSNDDKRLAGVTLELRNVLGLPFDAVRALPGVYDDGPIRITTDANGFYEFRGLRPGTYHVYQIQPDDFVDGLDTPGSTGGVAVNPADRPSDDDQIVIQTLAANDASDPRNDAILNISLTPGGHSSANNFSEILIVAPPQIAQIDSPSTPLAPVRTPIETFDPRIQLVSFADPRTARSVVYDIDEWAVSWHLSVINGGFPRGSGDDTGPIQGVSLHSMRQGWTEGQHSRGQWNLFRSDATRLAHGDAFVLGEQDGTALAGDFNGDGIDEAVLFVAGQWFVDMNGNGRWDAGDLWIQLGTALDRPVVGDWDGDGKDDVGIFGRQWQRDPQYIKQDPGLPDPDNKRRREVDSRQAGVVSEDRGEDRRRWLRRGTDGSLRADAVDHIFQYGEQVDTPLAGDWNGDGIDQIAVFREGHWLLDADGDGRWTSGEQRIRFGQAGDQPIVGDFNGDQIDEIGVVRGDLWIIDTDGDRRLTANDLQFTLPRESENSQPVVGDFDGDGTDDAGYYDEKAG